MKKGDVAWEHIVAIVIAVIIIGLLIFMILKTKTGFGDAGSEISGLLG